MRTNRVCDLAGSCEHRRGGLLSHSSTRSLLFYRSSFAGISETRVATRNSLISAVSKGMHGSRRFPDRSRGNLALRNPANCVLLLGASGTVIWRYYPCIGYDQFSGYFRARREGAQHFDTLGLTQGTLERQTQSFSKYFLVAMYSRCN